MSAAMEIHSSEKINNLLAAGKCATANSFACGHIVLTVAGMRLGFSREDFGDFAATIILAAENLQRRDRELAEWGLFF